MTIEILRHLHLMPDNSMSCVATLGNFDGIHQGHQKIIKKLKEEAIKYNLPSVLITFEPYPKEFFSTLNAAPRLLTFREKAALLNNYGIDKICCIYFDEKFSRLSPLEFISIILIKKLGVKSFIVGHDFHFGKNREGNHETLRIAAKKYNFDLISMPDSEYNQRRMSSTWVREALEKNNFDLVKKLLNRNYGIQGRVIHGDKRGREWGIPTANILLHRIKLPLKGIYIVQVKIISTKNKELMDSKWNGVASIGFRPMFSEPRGILEVHLFDFQNDLYGSRIEVIFLKKIRDETTFSSTEQLIRQIHSDMAEAKKFFLGSNDTR
jgi:riboflavin kinase / FMN adenylyltransferase